MQLELNPLGIAPLGLVLMFQVMLVVLGALLHGENIWQKLLLLVSVTPIAVIAYVLIFSLQ